MSGEFSLLQHLGVSVQAPVTSSPSGGAMRNECRVWSPARRPPLPDGAVEMDTMRSRKKATGKRYADPANEVLLGREDGREVEYVIYNSKVPSIYGVNKQLADARRREHAAQQERDRATAQPPVTLEDDTRDATRRQLLSELHRCNVEQAQLQREERLREAERRAAREADHLREIEARALRAEEAARVRRQADELALNEANREMAVRRRDAAAAARAAELAYAERPLISDDVDEAYSEAAARRVRTLMDDNQVLASRARERRERERQLDDLYAQRMLERAEQEAASERAALERSRARARAYGAEMEQEAAARRSDAAGARHIDECPVFLAPEKDEEKLEAHRALVAEEIREENRRLAEQKRQKTARQAERERSLAQQLIADEAAAEQRDRDRETQKKAKQQEDYRRAMEAAIATKQARLRAERDAQQQPITFLFGDTEAEKREAARKRKEQQLADEQRETAELRRSARQQREARQVAAERAALEMEAQAAKRDEARQRERATAENDRLRQDLERQIASRRAQQRDAQCAAGGLDREPLAPPRELYRCPVTGKLLPAEAFDFGRAR